MSSNFEIIAILKLLSRFLARMRRKKNLKKFATVRYYSPYIPCEFQNFQSTRHQNRIFQRKNDILGVVGEREGVGVGKYILKFFLWSLILSDN